MNVGMTDENTCLTAALKGNAPLKVSLWMALRRRKGAKVDLVVAPVTASEVSNVRYGNV